MSALIPAVALVVRYPIGIAVLEATARASDGRAFLIVDPAHPFALADCAADAAGLRRLEIASLNEPSAAQTLAEAGVRAVLMCGGREILQAAPLEHLPPVFNVHPSLLPRHRGPTPLFWTLRAGDSTYGVTVHRVTGRIDHGPVVLQRSRSVPLGATHDRLFEDAVELCGEVAAEVARAIVSGAPLPECAPIADPGSYERRPSREDLTIGLDTPCEIAARLVRASCSHYTVSVTPTGFSGMLYPAGHHAVRIPCADGEITAYLSP